MDKSIIKYFWESTNELHGFDYIYNIILFHAAPVLKSSKPSVLLTFDKSNHNLNLLWRLHKNSILKNLPLQIFEFRRNNNLINVLFYSKAALLKVVCDSKNKTFLSSQGYVNLNSVEDYLTLLSRKFTKKCPVEIGIFLGIPVEDIIGFIDNSGKNYLLSGYWKVYNNAEHATQLFDSFDMARLEIIKFLVTDNTHHIIPHKSIQ